MIKQRRMRWVRHVERMGEMRNACKIVVEKPEGTRPTGRLRRRLQDNIKMDLKEACDNVNCIHLSHEKVHSWAFVNMVMNLRVP
jgi:hypothetical protein